MHTLVEVMRRAFADRAVMGDPDFVRLPVNTLISKGKLKRFRGTAGRQSDVKKAVVTLADGHSIDVATGL